MNQPARRETDADATSAKQSNVTYTFSGKPNVVQPMMLPQPRNRQNAVGPRGFPSYPQSSRIIDVAQSQRAATPVARSRKADFVKRGGADIPKNERPVRGDNRTGLEPYGRLGWMGARAEYSLDGEG